MQVIKRDGNKVAFDEQKISDAVNKAVLEVHWIKDDRFSNSIAHYVTENIEARYKNRDISVEEIQDLVEDWLLRSNDFLVAKAYIRYRYERQLKRREQTDHELMSMIGGTDNYWSTENSNKNSKWVTVQRDYMAGIISKDIARNYIFPKETIKAHDAGIIHIHDMDYAAQRTLGNCCLINLNDMLQNGTVVNGVQIDKPHRLSTAMTIATQVISAVASSQYGLKR